MRQCYAFIESEYEPNDPTTTTSATGVITCALRQLNLASGHAIAWATHIMCQFISVGVLCNIYRRPHYIQILCQYRGSLSFGTGGGSIDVTVPTSPTSNLTYIAIGWCATMQHPTCAMSDLPSSWQTHRQRACLASWRFTRTLHAAQGSCIIKLWRCPLVGIAFIQRRVRSDLPAAGNLRRSIATNASDSATWITFATAVSISCSLPGLRWGQGNSASTSPTLLNL